jgi:hypothetical protein
MLLCNFPPIRIALYDHAEPATTLMRINHLMDGGTHLRNSHYGSGFHA